MAPRDLTDAVGAVNGQPCPNRPADVRLVKELLNRHAAAIGLTPPLTPADPAVGPRTLKAIADFQKLVMRKAPPYGRVLPASRGGKTLQALLGGTPVAPAPAGGGAAWMPVARREIGQRELAGAQQNPRIVAYHATTTLKATTDETHWCASFVNWCLRQAGVPGNNSARAADWLTWGQPGEAREGAITVIHNAAAANGRTTSSGNHVAFLVEETAGEFVLLGGNQSDSVKISRFPKARWRLRGYRWPRG